LADDEIACTIVSVEEVLRGWLAVIHRYRDVHRQLPAYLRLGQFLGVVGDWEIVPFDERAADDSQARAVSDPHRHDGPQDRVDCASQRCPPCDGEPARFRASTRLRVENWLK